MPVPTTAISSLSLLPRMRSCRFRGSRPFYGATFRLDHPVRRIRSGSPAPPVIRWRASFVMRDMDELLQLRRACVTTPLPPRKPMRGCMNAGPEPADTHAALIAAIARGQDRAAFAALFEYFAPRVKTYLTRRGGDASQAEELAQEALLTVWRKAAQYDPDGPPPRHGSCDRPQPVDRRTAPSRLSPPPPEPSDGLAPEPLADAVLARRGPCPPAARRAAGTGAGADGIAQAGLFRGAFAQRDRAIARGAAWHGEIAPATGHVEAARGAWGRP